MRTIWKYEVPLTDEFELELPKFSKVLSVGVQFGKPVLWVQVIADEPEKEKRNFLLSGTGNSLPFEQEISFIGTFQLYEGRLVGHLFDKV